MCDPRTRNRCRPSPRASRRQRGLRVFGPACCLLLASVFLGSSPAAGQVIPGSDVRTALAAVDAPVRIRPAQGPMLAPLREPRDPTVDLLHVSADVTPMDARGGLDVTVYLEMESLVDSLRRIALPASGLDVRSVQVLAPQWDDPLDAAPDSTAGAPEAPIRLDFLVVDDSLVVFPGVFAAGERFALRVAYSAGEGAAVRSTLDAVASGGSRASGGSGASWTPGVRTGGASWLPVAFDPPERFTAEVRVRTRGTQRVISGGTSQETRPAFRFDRPVTADQVVIAVTSDTPVVLGSTSGQVAYYGLAGLDHALPLFHADFSAALDFATRATGFVLPYDTLRVVFAEPDGIGLSGAGLIVADRMLLADARARLSIDPVPDIAELAARLWTDGTLGASSWWDAWVPEALAGWLSASFVEARQGRSSVATLRSRRFDAYLAEAQTYRRPLVWDRWEAPSDLLDAHAFARGAATLYLFEGMVGSAPFRSALRRLFASSSETGVDTEGLRTALEGASGRGLRDLFNAWVYGAGHPVLRLDARFDLDEERLHVDLGQVQAGDLVPGVFPIETDLRWMSLMEDGSTPVRMTDSVWTFSGVTGIEPRFVLVDADRRLPAVVEHGADLSALTAIVRYGPVEARLNAAMEMGRFADDPALPLAIRLAMERETETDVRLALTSLATALPAGGSLASLVRRAWTDSDAGVRAAAVRAAGAFVGDATWETFVREQATVDSAGIVLAAAVETLGAMRSADASFIARSAVITDSFGEQVRWAGFRVLAGDSSMTAFERRRTILEHTASDLDAGHVLAALVLAETHGPDRAVADRILDLLDHRSYRVRMRAAAVLAAVGTSRDRSTLERRLRAERDPAVRRALEETLARLGSN